MKSPVVKRSIVVANKTSVSLEEAFWNSMKEISGVRDMTLSELVSEIDQPQAGQSLVGNTPLRARLFSNPRRVSHHHCRRIGFEPHIELK